MTSDLHFTKSDQYFYILVLLDILELWAVLPWLSFPPLASVTSHFLDFLSICFLFSFLYLFSLLSISTWSLFCSSSTRFPQINIGCLQTFKCHPYTDDYQTPPPNLSPEFQSNGDSSLVKFKAQMSNIKFSSQQVCPTFFSILEKGTNFQLILRRKFLEYP